MPASKPSTVLTWAISTLGLARSVVPTAGLQADGNAVGDKPKAQHWNYEKNLIWNWLAYLRDFEQVARTWTALQSFDAAIGNTVAPASGSIRQLIASWNGPAGRIRVYAVWFATTRMGLELTINAAWANGTGLWTSDANSYAQRWRLNQGDSSLGLPGAQSMDTDYKAVTAAAQTWADTAWATNQLAASAFSAVGGSIVVNAAKRMPSGEAFLDIVFIASGAIGAAVTIFTLPAGWRPPVNTGQTFSSFVATTYPSSAPSNLQVSSAGVVTSGNIALSSGQTLNIRQLYVPAS